MKKLLILIVFFAFALLSYADNYGHASCKVSEIPGAYIYAEVNASSDRYIVRVTSYVVKEGTVEVEFDWEKPDGESDGESGHESVLVYFSDGKGSVDAGFFTKSSRYPSISNIVVFNPICENPN